MVRNSNLGFVTCIAIPEVIMIAIDLFAEDSGGLRGKWDRSGGKVTNYDFLIHKIVEDSCNKYGMD